MSSLLPLFQQLVGLIEGAEKPGPEAVASALDLDMKAVAVTKTSRGDFAIIDARRPAFPFAPNIGVFGDAARRSITLGLQGDDRCAYSPDFMADLPSRIEQSRSGEGFAVIATIDTFDVGCTASNSDQRLETIFCETRKSAIDLGESTGEKLASILMRQSAELDEFLGSLQNTSTDAEFEAVKSIVGQILGEAYITALQPIFAKYPNLKPDSFH